MGIESRLEDQCFQKHLRHIPRLRLLVALTISGLYSVDGREEEYGLRTLPASRTIGNHSHYNLLLHPFIDAS